MSTPAPNAHVPVAEALAGVAGVNDSLRCAAARNIVATAVRQRLILNSMGRSKVAPSTTADSLRKLESWLEVNPRPSMKTLQAFAAGDLMLHLRMVMPGNAAGKSRLDRLVALTR